MARLTWPTAEEQIARHLGGVLLTEEEQESLRRSLQPVAITEGGQSYYSCCRQYGPACQAGHREGGQCPVCGRTVYHLQRKWIRKNEREEQFHYFYRKSRADENTIIVMGVWVAEIWEDAKFIAAENVRTRIMPYSLVVLPYGGRPVRYIGEHCYGGTRWERREKVEGNTRTAWLSITSGIDTWVHLDEMQEAITGTRFEKMVGWAENAGGIYMETNRINLLAGIARHPQLEYLVARGLEGLARDVLNQTGLGAVNWRAKTADGMLPLTRDELGRIKAKGLQVQEKDLLLLKAARQLGQRVKLEDAMAAMHPLNDWAAREMAGLWKMYGRQFGVVKMARYVGKKASGHNVSLWADYLQELQELGEINDEGRAFPRDLHGAHAETSARIRVQASEKQQAELESRLQELRKKYTYHACGLVLEPFGTLAEVIEEGARQHICIGSYAARYAGGGTVLCKLRRESDPGTPWHAVEFTTGGHMVQCRGEWNTTAPEDEKAVRDFWAAWDAAHKTKTAVHILIRARRQAA